MATISVLDSTSTPVSVELPPAASVGTAIKTATEAAQTLLGTIDADTGTLVTATGAAADASSATGSIHAKLRAIATAVEILDNAIAGTEMQVDIVTMPNVTVAAGAADVTMATTTWTGSKGGVAIAGVRNDALVTLADTDDEYAPLQFDANGGAYVSPVATTNGGMTYKTIISGASNNETDVKTSPGQVYFLSVQSIDATPVYVKFFNTTAANTTMGTTPAVYQFMCPAAATAANGAGLVLNFNPGIYHDTAICVAITTGMSLTDNTSTSANEVVVTIGYK